MAARQGQFHRGRHVGSEPQCRRQARAGLARPKLGDEGIFQLETPRWQGARTLIRERLSWPIWASPWGFNPPIDASCAASASFRDWLEANFPASLRKDAEAAQHA